MIKKSKHSDDDCSTCNCSNESTRFYSSILPGGQNEVAVVTITSTCDKPEDPGEFIGSGTDYVGRKYASVEDARVDLLSAAAFGKRTGFDLAIRKPGGVNDGDDGDGDCVTTYVVELSNSTTAGLMISQVQLGADTHFVAIGVGQRQSFSTFCDEACITSRNASVTIVDQNGAAKTKLGRFQICECSGAV